MDRLRRWKLNSQLTKALRLILGDYVLVGIVKSNDYNNVSNGDIREGAKFDVGGGAEASFPLTVT